MILGLGSSQCYFKEVRQPAEANPGDTITVNLTVQEESAETTNAHKGLLGVLVPIDWTYISGTYSSSLGNGDLFESTAWTDSAEFYYPTFQYGENMKWICMLTDSGFIYSDKPSADISLRLKVGSAEGCFKLAYIATKGTTGLLGTGWTAFTYPHPIGVPDSGLCVPDDPSDLSTSRSLEWADLFNRKDGWTGADGIYSIPLDGAEQYSEESQRNTLFLFSDTFIGSVNEDSIRVGATLVNNTLALLKGASPLEENIKFTWGENNDGAPAAVFVPDTPQSNSGDWYWLMDGIAIADTVYVYGMRLKKTDVSWEILGVSLISFTLDDNLNLANIKQVDTPLKAESGDGKDIIIGQAIMPMTTVSRNPGADGYIYVYGSVSGQGTREMAASRFLPDDIRDFSKYRFWDGNNWITDIAQCAGITRNVSMEFSVTPLANGRFITVFQLNTVGRSVAVRFGDSPVGPFEYYKIIWDCPESDVWSNAFAYNAKAHPHLSKPGKLLISYNVNAFGWDSFTYADIYRPRFIVLDLEERESDVDVQENTRPAEFSLNQNFPNPFNSSTTISYTLNQSAVANVSIYDLSGRLVRELELDFKYPGSYQQCWDGKDNTGHGVASGIYHYQLILNAPDGNIYRVSRKMVFMK
jgi:hypothetical protein